VQFLASYQIIVQVDGCEIKLTPRQVSLLEKVLAWDLGNLQEDSDHLIRYLNYNTVPAPGTLTLKCRHLRRGSNLTDIYFRLQSSPLNLCSSCPR